MKTTILIIAFCLATIAGKAQWSYKFLSSHEHFLYTSGEFIVGQENGGNIGLNYVYNNKYKISLGYSATTKSSSSPTDEFLKSASNMEPAYASQPFENAENLHMMVGRIFNLSKKKSIRLVMQGGPGISTYREPIFEMASTGNKYGFKTDTSKKISFVMNPKFELPLCCTIGMSVGPLVVLNSKQTYFGAGIGLMYGIIKQ